MSKKSMPVEKGHIMMFARAIGTKRHDRMTPAPPAADRI